MILYLGDSAYTSVRENVRRDVIFFIVLKIKNAHQVEGNRYVNGLKLSDLKSPHIVLCNVQPKINRHVPSGVNHHTVRKR